MGRRLWRRYSSSLPLLLGFLIGLSLSIILKFLGSHCKINQIPQIDSFQSTSSSNGVFGPHNINEDFEKKEIETKAGGFLFVGVMTANKFLTTRARSVLETWAKDIPGKVVFFTGQNVTLPAEEKTKVNGMELVHLQNVDDSYPPQKKSFMMLKHMYEEYGDKYEWFMRADDDVYVRGSKLARFLRGLNSKSVHFIGQAGRGSRAERGTLNLQNDENFCMGGPGILFSQSALRLFGPNVESCLNSLLSTHEDVEVGRCVHRFANVSCTWAYEMQSIFYHNSSGRNAFTGNLKKREVHKAITLHPIKNFKNLYRLHAYIKGLEIEDNLYEEILLNRDILMVKNQLRKNDEVSGIFLSPLHTNVPDEFVGLPPSLQKWSGLHVFDYIGRKGLNSLKFTNPRQKIDAGAKEGIQDVVREVMEIINGFSRSRGRVVDFKQVLYGYSRVIPLFGEDLVLDLLLTYKRYRGRKITVPVRRHIYVQRPFSPLQLRLFRSPEKTLKSDDVNKSEENLSLIVPLYGKFGPLKRFLSNFLSVCLEKNPGLENHELHLVLVYFGVEEKSAMFISLLAQIKAQLPSQCVIKVVQVSGDFSRGVGLETGISQCKESDLLFLIDIDISFTSEALVRVLFNTVRGSQAYFPIVFSEYDPKFIKASGTNVTMNGSRGPINAEFGYFRSYGFGIGSFYKSDFRSVPGGFDTWIKGWGKEDVALFDKFISKTNLTIFRAVDVHLVHLFHEITCDPKLPKPQLEMCYGTMLNTMGSSKNLAEFLSKQTLTN